MTVDPQLARRLGERHLRERDELAPGVAELTRRRVRIVAGEEIATTVGGQHTIWMLANLVARQFGVVAELELVIPDVEARPEAMLFGEGETLADSIQDLAKGIAGDAVAVRSGARREEVEVEISIGRVENGGAQHRLSIIADGWRFFVGSPDRAPVILPETANPIGPYFAACVAAGEVFKRLQGLRPGGASFIGKAFFGSLWTVERGASWAELHEGEWPEEVALPPFYLVGAGAVGEAVAACLAAAPGIHSHVTVIDGETIKDSNLNRYVLTTQTSLGLRKDVLAGNILEAGGFSTVTHPGSWQEYLYKADREAQTAEVRALEQDFRYQLVLSCVDNNPARQGIQRVWPQLILGGSTESLSLQVSLYDMASPSECLACSNRVEASVETTIEGVAEKLRGMRPELRDSWLKERDLDVEAVEEYLRDPDCATAGEQEIQQFVAKGEEIDWAVGFVSAASGTLLAAQLIRLSLTGRQALTSGGPTWRFYSLNPGFRTSRHLRRTDCQLDCRGAGRTEYTTLWGDRVGD